MRKKTLLFLLPFFLAVSCLAGCAQIDTVVGKAENVLERTGLVQAPLPADYSAVSDYDELDADCYETPPAPGFYIVHKDMYYPMCYPDWCDDPDFAENLYGDADSEQMQVTGIRIAFENQYDPYIPTLYLSEGDSLIYCASDYLLEFYYLTKFNDLGYSVPITQFEQTVAGYPYVYLNRETETGNDGGVLIDNETKKLLLNQPVLAADDASATLRVYSVNNTPFTMDFIENNLIKDLTRDATYQFNGAFGSEDFQWTLPASYHFFKQAELYGEAVYNSNYNGEFELPIPDYLTDGYYMLSDGGMFRLLREASGYNLYDKEAFNEQSLGFDTQYALENGGSEDEEGRVSFADGTQAVNDTHMYSGNEALCAYRTKVPGKLGYKSDTPEDASEAGAEEKTAAAIAQMNVSYYKLVAKATEVSVSAGDPMLILTSDATGGRAPCMVQFCTARGTAKTVAAQKEETAGVYTYSVAAEQDITFHENTAVYLVFYHSYDAGLTMTQIADGLQAVQVSDEAELPQALLEATSVSGNGR